MQIDICSVPLLFFILYIASNRMHIIFYLCVVNLKGRDFPRDLVVLAFYTDVGRVAARVAAYCMSTAIIPQHHAGTLFVGAGYFSGS